MMFSYSNWRVIIEHLPELLGGLGLGLFMAAISLFLGMLIGLVMGIIAESHSSIGKSVAALYTGTIRNTPILLLIYITYFGLPLIGISRPSVQTFIITLTIYAGGYMTEVFRSGLRVVQPGLIEAGLATGLRTSQTLIYIRLPIVIRNVLPSLSNYMISLFKDTALAAAITVPELTYLTRKLTTDYFQVVEPWLTAGLMYVVTCYLLAMGLRRIERRVSFEG